MKKIWIINQYASTPETGIGGRSHYLAQELAVLGYDVTLIASSWHHLLRTSSPQNTNNKTRWDYKFVTVSVPRYAHAHDKWRFYNWLLFSHKIKKLPKRLKQKPDVILYSSPSLLGFLGAAKLAQKVKARLVFEVRDIWPLTLTEIGNISPKHPVMRWMQSIEDKAYRVSDAVISNLPNAKTHMVARGMDPNKFTWVPNGFSLSEFKNPESLSKFTKILLPKEKFIVGYTGTIGASNALETMIQAADNLRNNSDIAFVIVGKGRDQVKITKYIKTKGLTNVYMIEAIPKQQIQSMLAKFDACYIGLSHNPLFRFGVSPNKLFDYMLSGKPIIYGIDSGEYRPIEELNAGYNIAPEDPRALVKAILDLKDLSSEKRLLMGQRGRQAAIKHHDYSVLAQKLAKILIPK